MKLFKQYKTPVLYGLAIGAILTIIGLDANMWKFYFATISLVLTHSYLPFKN